MRLKFTFLLAFIIQVSLAQEKEVTGNVTDGQGMPLPGVNIVVKGTTTGTRTDFEGNYSITAGVGQVLQFTYVGMAAAQRTVGASAIIDLQMEEDAQALEEVIVVAYGEQSERTIVGSVAKIDSQVIETQQLTVVTTAIQGSVPGVNIIAAGGQPGDNPTIRVRGIGSINAAADPLIVVDGAPFNGNLNTISQDQIESMSVLKDASSTALYGSRGANGVILITTKKGKLNSPARVNFSTSLGFADQAVKFHDFLDADQYMELSWESLRNRNMTDGMTPQEAANAASNDLVEHLGYNPYNNAIPVGPDGRLVSTDRKWNTNWEDRIMNRNALRQQYGLTVSGGSDKTTYFFSANYLAQEGSVKTSDFNRATTRLNIDTRVNGWLSLGLGSSYSTQVQNYPEQSGSAYQSAIQWIYSVSPIYPLYRRDTEGKLVLDNSGKPIYDYGNTPGQRINASRTPLSGENAVGALYNYKVRNNRDNFTANGYAKIDFTENLSFKTNLSYEKYLFDKYSYAHNRFGYAANVDGRVSQDRDLTTTLNLINALNYNNTFGKHHLNVDIIQEAYQLEIRTLKAQGTGFLPNVYELNGSTIPEKVGGYTAKERLTSILARVAYNYDNRYFIEGSYRGDSSSRFAEKHRWGDFYSVGASWIVSEEEFLRNNEVLNYLKIKASYGELGNNRGIGFFPYLQFFNTGWNQGPNTGVLLGGVTDSLLSWEKIASFNAGMDMAFFNNKLEATVEYYNKESVDLIYDKPLSPSTGNSEIKTNVGAVRNYGVEVSLNSVNVSTADFRWITGLNFSFNRNEITELTQDGFISGTKRWEEGRSLYDFYIQEWAGVDPETGQGLWYKDVLDANGESTGEKETTSVYAEASRNYVGKSSLPDVIGGLTNYFKLGDWDMNILFNFSMGGYIYDSQYARIMGSLSSAGGAASIDMRNRWQNPGDMTDVPKVTTENNDYNSTSTRFLFKNNYLRLKALNFGYNLPTAILDKYGINNIRVYFQGDNLLTFKSHKGIDPEQSLSGTTNYRSYNQRIFSLGLNIGF